MTDEFAGLLQSFRQGNQQAAAEIWDSIYLELKQIARGHQKKPNQTLSATALVNETYLKLFGKGAELQINDRAHFMALCCRAMRMVAVEYVREKHAAKRGDGNAAITIDDRELAERNPAIDMLDLNRAIDKLSQTHHRLVHLIDLKMFGGFSTAEIATLLDISTRTAERDWLKAKMFLYDFMDTHN